MTNIFIQDLKQHLITAAIVTSSNCFINHLPDSPDDAVSITQYYSRDDKPTNLESIYIQILARSETGLTAYNLVNAIYKNIVTDEGYKSINSRRAEVRGINKTHYLKTDENNRDIYICNINVITTLD